MSVAVKARHGWPSKWIYWHNKQQSLVQRTLSVRIIWVQKFRRIVDESSQSLLMLSSFTCHLTEGRNIYRAALSSEVPPVILPPLLGDMVCLWLCVFVVRALLPKGHVQDAPLGPSDWPLSAPCCHHLPAIFPQVKRFKPEVHFAFHHFGHLRLIGSVKFRITYMNRKMVSYPSFLYAG